MEDYKDINRILELMPQPVFCVRDGIILCCNHAAGQLYLEPGLPVAELLGDALQDYLDFQGSSLYVQLKLPGILLGAGVTRMDGMDIFVSTRDQSELQTMALAALQFREPLTEIMLILNRDGESMETGSRGQLQRRLFQMQRLVQNMSDAMRYTTQISDRQTCEDICAVVEEMLQRISVLTEQSGYQLTYSCPQEQILTMLNKEKLERALYNMISNAMKVTPKGGTIEVKLTCVNRRLRLSVRDYGAGIPQEIAGNLFTRYQRQPGLDSGQEGLGLGMTMIRSMAVEHGGAVLIDHPDDIGTRVTVTMSIRNHNEAVFRSQVKGLDYGGERDHGLIELSAFLPPEIYTTEI